jgi:hypothetical protein
LCRAQLVCDPFSGNECWDIYKFDTNEWVGVFLARHSMQHLVVSTVYIDDLWLTKLIIRFTNISVRQVTFIEQKGKCIIRYFGRPCDKFAEWVWPIKISDGVRVTLFNKGPVSCDVNQSWVRVCMLYGDILYILLSKILYDVTSSSSTSSLGIMRYCTAVDNRKDEKAWCKV